VIVQKTLHKADCLCIGWNYIEMEDQSLLQVQDGSLEGQSRGYQHQQEALAADFAVASDELNVFGSTDNYLDEAEERDEELVAWRRAVSLLFSGRTVQHSELPQPQEQSPCDCFCGWSSDLLITTTPRFPPPTRVRHIPQLFHWDCGIACLLMVLDWLELVSSSELEDDDRQELTDGLATQSVWTADLVMQLERRIQKNPSRGRYLFCSQTLQVNDDLGDFAYYQNAFASDRVRVQEIFEHIRSRKLPAVKRSNLQLEEIVQLIQHPDCVAIMLVDNSFILASSGNGKDEEKEAEEFGCFASTETSTSAAGKKTAADTSCTISASRVYMGHYLVITGIVPNDDDADLYETDRLEESERTRGYPYLFQVHNPALEFGNILLSPRLLDEARRAPGTDQDIIFVVKH
jgi:Guanylylate cyclase